ncbi:MAG: leucine--tRNA ligase [Candidatus Micrarchaeota archaeon]
MAFDFRSNEIKWQKEWEKARIHEANLDPLRKKFLITFPYPYLNGSMHVGHSYSFFRTDAYARFMRMKGLNVLFPQGFHATGEPIMGTVERLRNGDIAQIENFRKAGATDGEIENFKKGPEEVARFWMGKWISDLKAAGASIDWRRTFITTDLTPQYSRFIEWQYNTLKRKGYVVQGTHPVIWCPHDKSPTGDHDRYVGEGESPVEYTVIKFSLDFEGRRLIVPCATLRPETLLGVTNIWLNPGGKYVVSKVDGEAWLLSEDAAKKLADQQHDVNILGEIKAADLIGKKCSNPLLQGPVPILPAPFVLPGHSTGVVMSVPGHAPYDFMALEDLKKNVEEQEKYGLSASEIKNLRLVSLISAEGQGEFPAADECARLGISLQSQSELLEEATSNVYRREFHKGKLKAVYGEFSGLLVSECKEKMIEKYRSLGISSSMWEPTGEVVCRCMTKCHVKILENQWFLKFSDPEWKSLVREHLKTMDIFPQEARLQLENTIDWLQNKACARKGGLGTRLPWDLEWKVETLSDSTIYMAYYTIARIINENKIPSENLTDGVFDHILTGIGDLGQVSKASGLAPEVISEMRGEFEYFYPVDLRNSGKDLLQNHLIFFVFHHTAIFSKANLPKGISVNGYVTVEGEKMSKSKGNFLPIRNLVGEFGADLVRINIIASGENLDDADWRVEGIRTYRRNFEFVLEAAAKLKGGGFSSKEEGRPEHLLMSRLESCVKSASENMSLLKFRSAAHYAVFEAIEALRKYLNTKGQDANRDAVNDALSKITLMICPFAPHFSEEAWSMLGNGALCALSPYPIPDDSKINRELDEEEKYLENTLGDIRKIIEITNSKPKTIRLFAPEKWKGELFKISLKRAEKEGKFNIPSLIKAAIADETFKQYSKSIPPFLLAISKAVNYFKSGDLPEFDELQLLNENKRVFEEAFGCNVEVYPADATGAADPARKAQKALPFKPAIYLL